MRASVSIEGSQHLECANTDYIQCYADRPNAGNHFVFRLYTVMYTLRSESTFRVAVAAIQGRPSTLRPKGQPAAVLALELIPIRRFVHAHVRLPVLHWQIVRRVATASQAKVRTGRGFTGSPGRHARVLGARPEARQGTRREQRQTSGIISSNLPGSKP